MMLVSFKFRSGAERSHTEPILSVPVEYRTKTTVTFVDVGSIIQRSKFLELPVFPANSHFDTTRFWTNIRVSFSIFSCGFSFGALQKSILRYDNASPSTSFHCDSGSVSDSNTCDRALDTISLFCQFSPLHYEWYGALFIKRRLFRWQHWIKSFELNCVGRSE